MRGEEAPGGKMTKKILIVDDEPAMLTYLSTVLQDHGYTTVCSQSAEEAWEKALEESPDLITLDLLMPEKTGIKLYKDLRKHDRLGAIPIVIITGFTQEQYPMIDFRKFIYERSIRGPEAFLEKPVAPEALVETVEKVLGCGTQKS